MKQRLSWPVGILAAPFMMVFVLAMCVVSASVLVGGIAVSALCGRLTLELKR